MTVVPTWVPRRIALVLLVAAMMGQACAARAQQAASSGGSVTERLIELLVQKGVLPRDQAAALLRQAQQEAKAAKPEHQPGKVAARKPAPSAAKPSAEASAGGAAAETPEALPPGTVRVTYVPETVRKQIADQVRSQVMQQAKDEGWAQPNLLPEWVQRLTVFGDLRIRGESDLFQKDNYPYFPDFQSINNGPGYDVNGGALPPLLNTTENRERVRLRARIGVDARIDDWVMSEVRIGTGNDDSPVSGNQTLGQNGDFTKYAVWLDRAFVKTTPTDWFTAWAGRMPNPFWTSDLMYYDDLGFDGFAASVTPRLNDRIGGFLTAGAFPVFNSAFNFASTSVQKYPSRNAWLFGIQGGGDWRISENYAAKLGVGYFKYSNVEGKLSSPCVITYSSDSCSTDDTVPLFVQFGNTMFPVRNIVPNPNSTTGGTMPQYFGLASPFDVLDLHGRFDINTFKPIGIAVEGDFVTNLAFNRNNIVGHNPANNLGANNYFQGGGMGYLVRVTVGTAQIAKRWDWNASLAYKYLETDAVLATLTDPDFHLGGTNAKGFIAIGNLGVAKNTWISLRWLSANQISGPPYGVDVLQADLNVRF